MERFTRATSRSNASTVESASSSTPPCLLSSSSSSLSLALSLALALESTSAEVEEGPAAASAVPSWVRRRVRRLLVRRRLRRRSCCDDAWPASSSPPSLRPRARPRAASSSSPAVVSMGLRFGRCKRWTRWMTKGKQETAMTMRPTIAVREVWASSVMLSVLRPSRYTTRHPWRAPAGTAGESPGRNSKRGLRCWSSEYRNTVTAKYVSRARTMVSRMATQIPLTQEAPEAHRLESPVVPVSARRAEPSVDDLLVRHSERDVKHEGQDMGQGGDVDRVHRNVAPVQRLKVVVGNNVILEQCANAHEKEEPVEDSEHNVCHAKHFFVWRRHGDALTSSLASGQPQVCCYISVRSIEFVTIKNYILFIIFVALALQTGAETFNLALGFFVEELVIAVEHVRLRQVHQHDFAGGLVVEDVGAPDVPV
mmetsp:Transcript_21118/g.67314  ORF Transcript_21118/g.67314 Transcript_21118/m.67314 type:complete len:424 (+) Transcript_21118:235-1506(+)